MINSVMLDSGPLGRIAHPRPNKEIALWLKNLLIADIKVIIPEIAAQAMEAKSVVVTENIAHLSIFVEAKKWDDISID